MMVLTDNEIEIFVISRPVDALAGALVAASGCKNPQGDEHSTPLEVLRKEMGEVEFMQTLLLLVASQGKLTVNISEVAHLKLAQPGILAKWVRNRGNQRTK
jgi:hypothetical protein